MGAIDITWTQPQIRTLRLTTPFVALINFSSAHHRVDFRHFSHRTATFLSAGEGLRSDGFAPQAWAGNTWSPSLSVLRQSEQT